jgi:cupin 2 domain-containing protein
MITVHNLLADIPGEMPEELVGEILRTDALRIERIVSRGQTSPPGFWYDQETDEWVLLLIPRHVRHRVERTDPQGETVWLAVHFGGEKSLLSAPRL